jgi:hypothetical protein
MYVPQFHPNGYTVMNPDGKMLGRMDSEGVFSLYLDSSLGKVYEDLDELINLERHLLPNIMNTLRGETNLIKIPKGFKFSLDHELIDEGYDGSAALKVIIEKFSETIYLNIPKIIKDAEPDFLIPGHGASGLVTLKDYGLTVTNDVYYPIHFFYLGADGFDFSVVQQLTARRYGLEFERIDDGRLDVFKEFLDKL